MRSFRQATIYAPWLFRWNASVYKILFSKYWWLLGWLGKPVTRRFALLDSPLGREFPEKVSRIEPLNCWLGPRCEGTSSHSTSLSPLPSREEGGHLGIRLGLARPTSMFMGNFILLKYARNLGEYIAPMILVKPTRMLIKDYLCSYFTHLISKPFRCHGNKKGAPGSGAPHVTKLTNFNYTS